MGEFESNVWADFDRNSLVLLWRWEVLRDGRIVLSGLEDTRNSADAKSDAAIARMMTCRIAA